MAYEMKDNTFSINFNQENINQKFPALKIKVKKDGQESELAAWIRTSKYGTEIAGNLENAIQVLSALFGGVAKNEESFSDTSYDLPVQESFQKKEVSRNSLIR
jgi:hypothetical protein